VSGERGEDQIRPLTCTPKRSMRPESTPQRSRSLSSRRPIARQGGEPRACETHGDGICLAKVRRLIKVAVSQYQRTPDPGVPKIKSTHNTRPRKAQDGARLIIPPARKVGDKFSPDLPFRRPSCPAETSSASGEPARRSSGRPQPSNSRSRSSAAPGTARLFIS
jgi:hypothetical protein